MSISSKVFFTYTEFKQAADFIQGKTSHQPTIGHILGSGLGPLAEEIEAADIIPYEAYAVPI